MKKKLRFVQGLAAAGLLVMGGYLLGRQQIVALTPEMLQQAAQVIDLEFEAAQLDSMLGNVTANRASYGRIRQQELENSLAPALYFNPLPHGFTPPGPSAEAPDWGLPAAAAVALPEREVDIAFLSVAELSVLIRERKLSSERLTRIYIDRHKAFGDTLEAVITLLEERALAQARRADSLLAAGTYLGPLHGIPYGAKDLLAVKGTKTTWGAMPFKEQVIEETAHIVERLEAAGAVLVSKLTLGALAMGDVWYGGVTKNPWNLQQGASGSSAGSASAVAAGLVPFAIGTETLGSIVSPSTRNGVTGLRPTFGRVSRHGAMALSWSMDKIGPISRSALDNALVLDVIQGADAKDKSTVAAGFTYQAGRKVEDLKIAYIESYFRGDGAGAQNDLAVLESLRAAGLRLEPVKLDVDIASRDLIIMLYAEGAAAFDALTRSGEDKLLVAQDRRAWSNTFRSARFIPAVEYIQAARVRSQLQEAFHAWMQEYDVVISPSFGGSQLAITNLTGHPALCMPNGFTENGTPTSITFLANLFEEEKLIMLGRFFQERTDWQNRRPVLFDRDPTAAERVAKRSFYLN